MSSELCSGLPELSSGESSIGLVPFSFFCKTLPYSIHYSFSTLLGSYFVQYYTCYSIVVYLVCHIVVIYLVVILETHLYCDHRLS